MFRPVLWRTFDPDGGVHHYCRKPENVATEVAWSTQDGRATVHHGDCLDVMPTLDAGGIDAVVCDPPYGLAFMGKEWDHGVPGAPFWIEALRLAKPGAHLLAFGGTRTFHRLTCAIEDAGWEIRDCLSWLYGSGFPKSHNGAWGGTALKPAWEPVILARKPLIGTVAANHAAHGTGALNIDGCRIATNGEEFSVPQSDPNNRVGAVGATAFVTQRDHEAMKAAQRASIERTATLGRWPANVALDEDAAAALDEQSGVASPKDERTGERGGSAWHGRESFGSPDGVGTWPADSGGGASRFFYTAKASRSEREAGLTGAKSLDGGVWGGTEDDLTDGKKRTVARANTHPTVKPVDLMRWLVRLVTPIGGTVLDPFLGSGTTGVAALQEGCRFVGIEREAQYVEIAKARIAHEAAQGSLFGGVS